MVWKMFGHLERGYLAKEDVAVWEEAVRRRKGPMAGDVLQARRALL